MSSELSMFMLLCMSSDLYIFRSPVYILRYFIIAYYYRWQRCLILFFLLDILQRYALPGLVS
ncbi:Os06g0504450 [Oryza sativa Japonica Group]|uniref:Os06g0504450 protein n=1 Tax=Oryza sativa subsp. japonica TaxID=39947 RepID=A0A0P0WWZ2_ORYSJ|nr:Os06g0504450 [Oryza sativa Japonica Group]